MGNGVRLLSCRNPVNRSSANMQRDGHRVTGHSRSGCGCCRLGITPILAGDRAREAPQRRADTVGETALAGCGESTRLTRSRFGHRLGRESDTPHDWSYNKGSRPLFVLHPFLRVQ